MSMEWLAWQLQVMHKYVDVLFLPTGHYLVFIVTHRQTDYYYVSDELQPTLTKTTQKL